MRFRYLDILINLFVVALIVSNLVAGKIVAFGDLRVSGAQILFPLTYIFGDIFTEVYGYSASRRAIWTGFIASTVLAVMGLIVVALPPAPEWHDQVAFEKVFYTVPRVIAGSLLAYWCGEFANAFVMAKLKLFTRGRHLWVRTIGSTAVGQLVDTVIVMIFVFAGKVDVATILNLIGSGYLVKVVYEVAATPLTYLVVNGLKRLEGVEIFDESTDFNPFASGPEAPAAAVPPDAGPVAD
jgi:queuosine precursor transporter